jgi:hypothetical protein
VVDCPLLLLDLLLLLLTLDLLVFLYSSFLHSLTLLQLLDALLLL